MEETRIQVDEVMDLLKERRFAELRSRLSDLQPIDVAQILGEVPEEKLLLLYRILPQSI